MIFEKNKFRKTGILNWKTANHDWKIETAWVRLEDTCWDLNSTCFIYFAKLSDFLLQNWELACLKANIVILRFFDMLKMV